jgi:hypothetical protein
VPPKRTLTSFLIALSDSAKLRDRFRDPEKRQKLLRDWELSDHPALQSGATLDQVRAAVAAEGGETQVEWWILVDSAPTLNDGYDPNA